MRDVPITAATVCGGHGESCRGSGAPPREQLQGALWKRVACVRITNHLSLRMEVVLWRERRRIVCTEIVASPLCALVEGTLKLRVVWKLKLPKEQEDITAVS